MVQSKLADTARLEHSDLLTVNAGGLTVTAISVAGSPNWLVPSSLVVEAVSYTSACEQEAYRVLLFSALSLAERGRDPEMLVVLQGHAPEQSIGLLVNGELEEYHIKIADIKDAEDDLNRQVKKDNGDRVEDYILQNVVFNHQIYAVPDIVALSEHMISTDKISDLNV